MQRSAVLRVLIPGVLILAAVIAVSSRQTQPPTPVSAGSNHLVESAEPKKLADLSAAHPVMVGTQACAGCHTDQHRSYQRTAHSRAMSLVDPSAEPPDAEFTHLLSGRHYQVFRETGKLWHSESLAATSENLPGASSSTNQPKEISAREPVRYLVGSGRHSRTYLVEQDGFLTESPVTWYASTQKWAMSPGYDQRFHAGFERAADDGCVICHAGQLTSTDKLAYGRSTFAELAIGCERCHGPGSSHVEKWQQPQPRPDASATTADPSIVHPGRLDRSLQDDLCAQCHLRGDATVLVSGKSLADFRPGTRLSKARVDYHLESQPGSMKVVGHTEQMQASTCYQKSATLTCITCHSAHHDEPLQLAPESFRSKCIACHESSDCGLEFSQRQQTNPVDNCVECHMPQVSTDIPHIAFTHHRIGIHKPQTPGKSSGEESIGADSAGAKSTAEAIGQLVPFGDVSHLSHVEQRRCLGLAYTELSYKTGDPSLAEHYRKEALTLLRETAATGHADGEVFAALARFAWEDRETSAAFTQAQQAVSHSGISAGAHANSLFILGDSALQSGQPAAAAEQLRRLVTLRRNSQDWLVLGLAEFQSGRRDAAVTALKQAIKIQPFRPDLHSALSELYQTTGHPTESAHHKELARRLSAP